MSEVVQPSVDDLGAGRRRFLKRAGLAAGAAYVAPAILGATPAAAQASGCVPQTTIDEGTCPGAVLFVQEVPAGCPDLVVNAFISQNGGPFALVFGCSPVAAGDTFGVQAANREVTWQFRYDWFDTCGGTLLSSFTSPLYPTCPSPVGAPADRSASAGELIVTDLDGNEIRIPSP